jgi:predicted  nucleic acid-binding Zn-ribbon protein
MSEDRCVCCGEIIPEGRMICKRCEMSGEDVAKRLSDRIAHLEEEVRYHETTIRLILADAAAEEAKAEQTEAEAILYANPEDTIALYHQRRMERQRNVERIRCVLRKRNFRLEEQ